MKKQAGNFVDLVRDSMDLLRQNDPLRLAAATAFFTTFALPAILFILIQVLGLVFKKDRISDDFFVKLQSILGSDTAQQIINILQSFSSLAQTWYVTAGGFLFLIFVATTLFVVIKSSLNQVWGIHLHHKRKISLRLKMRLRSLLVILFSGILFLVGMMAESIQVYLGKTLQEFIPNLTPFLKIASNILISIVIVSGWFMILFRYLPDGQPTWRVVAWGGVVTSILFNIGKWILHWLLSSSNLNTVYGASASLVLLLLFVFYSSLIFYFGASFTRQLSEKLNEPIRHASYTMDAG